MLQLNKKPFFKKVKYANTFFERALGLMFEDKMKFDYALVFSFPRESQIGCSLHMLFVFFPIDVLFLDKKKRVVDKATLNPWILNYTPKKAAQYVIEMPKGITKKVKHNDQVTW